MPVSQDNSTIEESDFILHEITKMAGVNMSSIRIVDMCFFSLTPGLKYIGAAVDDATVTIKKSIALPQLHITGNNCKLGAVINSLEGEALCVIENVHSLQTIPAWLAVCITNPGKQHGQQNAGTKFQVRCQSRHLGSVSFFKGEVNAPPLSFLPKIDKLT